MCDMGLFVLLLVFLFIWSRFLKCLLCVRHGCIGQVEKFKQCRIIQSIFLEFD